MFIAFVPTNAVLVRKRRHTFGAHKPKAPSGRKAIMLLPDSIQKEYEQNARTPFLFRQVLLLHVILSVVRMRFCSAHTSHCYAVRLRYASLRMTRADAVETRRANSNAVRISQGNKPALW